jgi:hypothetical protein
MDGRRRDCDAPSPPDFWPDRIQEREPDGVTTKLADLVCDSRMFLKSLPLLFSIPIASTSFPFNHPTLCFAKGHPRRNPPRR